jgi:hypothetical protein
MPRRRAATIDHNRDVSGAILALRWRVVCAAGGAFAILGMLPLTGLTPP